MSYQNYGVTCEAPMEKGATRADEILHRMVQLRDTAHKVCNRAAELSATFHGPEPDGEGKGVVPEPLGMWAKIEAEIDTINAKLLASLEWMDKIA